MKKKRIVHSVIAVITLNVLFGGIGMIDSLPWWTFVPVGLIFGVAGMLLEWDIFFFGSGFLAGFLIWFCGNLYFDLTFNGILLSRIALMAGMPKLVLILVAGLTGGLCGGLSVYTGKNVFASYKATLQ